MTATQDLAVCGRAGATVLVTDEDWEWIAVRGGAVGAAIDQTKTEERTGTGSWMVCGYAIDGDAFVVAATLEDTKSSHRSVGSVVLVATAATIEAHVAASVRR